MFKRSLRIKFIGTLALLLLVSFIVLYFLIINALQNTIEEKETQYSLLLQHAIENQMASQLDSARMSVLSISENAEIQRLFAMRDRDALARQLLPVYSALKSQVSQIQFHLPDSTAFLRLHMPSEYGDSLKSFRFTVNEANAKKTIVSGLEEGRGGYGFRVVVPISYQGAHIGSVEYGSGFGENFLNRLKSSYTGDYFIYILDSENSVSWNQSTEEQAFIAATISDDLWPLEPTDAETLAAGEILKRHSADDQYLILALPYKDYQGNVVGYIKAIIDRSVTAATEVQTRWIALVSIAAISIILLVALALMSNYLVLAPVGQVNMKVQAIAQGDFKKATLDIHTQDEFGTLATSFNHMIANLSRVLNQIQHASDQVALGSHQVAESSQTLSSGANKQSEAITTLTDQISNVLNQAKLNEQAAQAAVLESGQTKELVSLGSEHMHAMNQSMASINEASANISKIIKVIDEIAFQTNILALNAAVEAARAGDHGKGFAVVAEEVRNLAAKSAAAAKETTALIENSISRVTEGTHITKETGDVLNQILDRISKVTQLIEQISLASQDQSQGVSHISQGIQEIAEVVSITASTAISSAAASEELSGQAQVLKDEVSNFNI